MVKRLQGKQYRSRNIHMKPFLSRSWVSSVSTIQGRVQVKLSSLHVWTSVTNWSLIQSHSSCGYIRVHFHHFLQSYILEPLKLRTCYHMNSTLSSSHQLAVRLFWRIRKTSSWKNCIFVWTVWSDQSKFPTCVSRYTDSLTIQVDPVYSHLCTKLIGC